MTARRALLVALGLVAVASLPLLGRTIRGSRAEHCALDGVALDKAHRVLIADTAGRQTTFCCVDCAQSWLAKSGAVPRDVRVVDETSGADIAADEAWFVSSRVVAFPPTGCRIHVFWNEFDARRHAEAFRGTVLTGDERPFRGGPHGGK